MLVRPITAAKGLVDGALNASAVHGVLGDPKDDVSLPDGIVDSSRYKTLIGLTLLTSERSSNLLSGASEN